MLKMALPLGSRGEDPSRQMSKNRLIRKRAYLDFDTLNPQSKTTIYRWIITRPRLTHSLSRDI